MVRFTGWVLVTPVVSTDVKAMSVVNDSRAGAPVEPQDEVDYLLIGAGRCERGLSAKIRTG